MSDIFESDIDEEEEADVTALEKLERAESRKKNKKTSKVPAGSYKLRLNYSNEWLYAVPRKDFDLKKGDLLMVNTPFGADIAEYVGTVNKTEILSYDGIFTVIRIATEDDLERQEYLKSKEKDALETFEMRIAEHNLEMRAEAAHFTVGEGRVIFFFISDHRVDFRELVKSLVGDFHMRIELRQMTPRELCRMKGGIGRCGRKLCCTCMVEDMNRVCAQFIKVQDVSMKADDLTGFCGRFLCCLTHEADWYFEERRLFPRRGTRLKWRGEQYYVTSVNMVMRKVMLRNEDGAIIGLPIENITREDGLWQITAMPTDDD